jgi:hypothetical protein
MDFGDIWNIQKIEELFNDSKSGASNQLTPLFYMREIMSNQFLLYENYTVEIKKALSIAAKCLILLVGATGFEPATT